MVKADLDSQAERLVLIRKYGARTGFNTNLTQSRILNRFTREEQALIMEEVAPREAVEEKVVMRALFGEDGGAQ
jgi:hypothetical protein